MKSILKSPNLANTLMIAATIFACIPSTKADAQSSSSSAQSSSSTSFSTLLKEFEFGPNTYSITKSMTKDGKHQIDLDLGQGKHFSYVDGRAILIKNGNQNLLINIVGSQVQVGNSWCASDDQNCIVHGIRRQIKGLSPDDFANTSGALHEALNTVSFGGVIDAVIQGLATMPVTTDDD